MIVDAMKGRRGRAEGSRTMDIRERQRSGGQREAFFRRECSYTLNSGRHVYSATVGEELARLAGGG